MRAVEQLARLLGAGGLRTHALQDARGPQWTKVIFNSATSPLAALTGLSVGRVCTDAGLRGARGHRGGVRPQAEHAAGRPGAAGDRDRRTERRHRRRRAPGRRCHAAARLHGGAGQGPGEVLVGVAAAGLGDTRWRGQFVTWQGWTTALSSRNVIEMKITFTV